MASSERVLTGRSARRQGEPWGAPPGGWRSPAAGSPSGPDAPVDPLAEPVVRAALAEAARAAEERGFTVGREGAEQELAAAIVAAQAFAHKLETAVPRDVEMLARTVAELSVLIARRILAAELRQDPSVLIAAIESGLRQAAGASVVNVELHPTVVDRVEATWVGRHGTRHRGFAWSFAGDPTLPLDGCRLRTEHGLVEAGFEDQLSEVAAALDIAIPGYLGAALGPSAAAGRELPAWPSTATRGTRPAVHPAAVPAIAADPAAAAAPPAPAMTAAPEPDARRSGVGSLLGVAAGVPDDIDLDALASLGLEGLDGLESLESLGLDTGSGGAGEGMA